MYSSTLSQYRQRDAEGAERQGSGLQSTHRMGQVQVRGGQHAAATTAAARYSGHFRDTRSDGAEPE